MRIKLILLAIVLALAPMGAKAQEAIDSVSMAAGVVIGNIVKRNLADMERSGIKVDVDQFVKALGLSVKGDATPMDVAKANDYMTQVFQKLNSQAEPDTVSVASQREYLDKMASLPGAVRTPSGVVFSTVAEGKGATPGPHDRVMVSYVGVLSDGTEFDNTDGEAIELDVDRLVPGFTEGLMMMRKGGVYRLTIPAELAYGSEGIPGVIPGNAAIDFTVNLQDIIPQGSK